MKKIFACILVLITIVCCAGCGASENTLSDGVYNSTFEPGTELKLKGGGAVQFIKVHTANRLYPSLHFGSYIESSEDMCYIDVVFQLQNGKETVYSADIGTMSAKGTDTGNVYTDYVCAIESNGNVDLHTNAKIEPQKSAVVHMAVEVPADEADDEFEITVNVHSDTYSFLYEFGEKIDNTEHMDIGQNISNHDFKVKLNDVYYSDELYEDAPSKCDSDENYVYLISELAITNKTSSDADFLNIVSVSAVYGNDIYDARYIMQADGEDGVYLPGGKIEASDTASVLAVIDFPAEYSLRDVRLEYAIDQNVFVHTIDGDEMLSRQRQQELEEQERAEAAKQRAREDAARKAAEADKKASDESAKQQEQQKDPEQTDEDTDENLDENTDKSSGDNSHQSTDKADNNVQPTEPHQAQTQSGADTLHPEQNHEHRNTGSTEPDKPDESINDTGDSSGGGATADTVQIQQLPAITESAAAAG